MVLVLVLWGGKETPVRSLAMRRRSGVMVAPTHVSVPMDDVISLTVAALVMSATLVFIAISSARLTTLVETVYRIVLVKMAQPVTT